MTLTMLMGVARKPPLKITARTTSNLWGRTVPRAVGSARQVSQVVLKNTTQFPFPFKQLIVPREHIKGPFIICSESLNTTPWNFLYRTHKGLTIFFSALIRSESSWQRDGAVLYTYGEAKKSRQLQFAQSNLISICSRQFLFAKTTHYNFNMLTTSLSCSRQI